MKCKTYSCRWHLCFLGDVHWWEGTDPGSHQAGRTIWTPLQWKNKCQMDYTFIPTVVFSTQQSEPLVLTEDQAIQSTARITSKSTSQALSVLSRYKPSSKNHASNSCHFGADEKSYRWPSRTRIRSGWDDSGFAVCISKMGATKAVWRTVAVHFNASNLWPCANYRKNSWGLFCLKIGC